MNFESYLEGVVRSEQAANQQLHDTANDHATQRRNQANATSKAALEKHKAEQAKKKSLVHKVKKLFKFEEFIGESTGNVVGHKFSVTVSDPNHAAVTQRKVQVQRHITVKSTSDKQKAHSVATSFYKKRGFKVHAIEHHSEIKG